MLYYCLYSYLHCFKSDAGSSASISSRHTEYSSRFASECKGCLLSPRFSTAAQLWARILLCSRCSGRWLSFSILWPRSFGSACSATNTSFCASVALVGYAVGLFTSSLSLRRFPHWPSTFPSSPPAPGPIASPVTAQDLAFSCYIRGLSASSILTLRDGLFVLIIMSTTSARDEWLREFALHYKALDTVNLYWNLMSRSLFTLLGYTRH
ncbi:hypothetical protein HD806DRAFT_512966 [Xylariaceae sp. AK1471]|nr:hypothetical protein HD806DRAFT_512966 [Xylariaceae sp. AK1471]